MCFKMSFNEFLFLILKQMVSKLSMSFSNILMFLAKIFSCCTSTGRSLSLGAFFKF